MAVITESDRKFIRNWLNIHLDKLREKRDSINRQIDSYTIQSYNDNDLEQLYNKTGPEYKADIDAQLIFVQSQIDRFQNIKQWLNDLVL